jgi:hypothetical protein
MRQDQRRLGCLAELIGRDVNFADRARQDLSQERKTLDVDQWGLGRSQLGLQFRRNPLLGAAVSVPIAGIEADAEQSDTDDDDQYPDQRRGS